MIAVFTPTLRCGIDVNREGLIRQDRLDLLWIVGDDLYTQRDIPSTPELPAVHFDTGMNKRAHNTASSLASAYRVGMDIARDHGADLFVSMQDYLWIPDDGISRFEEMALAHPSSLLTGLSSLSSDPPVETVRDATDLYTIFYQPFDGTKPTDIRWPDCRLEIWEPNIQARCDAVWWESNWAAIPRNVLHDRRLNFDTAYDRGTAYENQDYAMRAQALGYDVWIDTANHSIGLPHELYFPEDAERLRAINNRVWHEDRHAPRLG